MSFHVWNIRTLRPKVLVDYDYENENYFPSLWIAEGITSYYDDLSLVRSGVIGREDYFKSLSGRSSDWRLLQVDFSRVYGTLLTTPRIKYYARMNTRETRRSAITSEHAWLLFCSMLGSGS